MARKTSVKQNVNIYWFNVVEKHLIRSQTYVTAANLEQNKS